MKAAPAARINIKVSPGASRDAVDGWMGDVLKVRVKAAPERGKANAAVAGLLASTLGVAKSEVEVVSGHASPRKVVRVVGISKEEVGQRLPRIAPEP